MMVVRKSNLGLVHTVEQQPLRADASADASLELGRLRTSGDLTVVCKWFRYINSCDRYCSILNQDFQSAQQASMRGMRIDVAQAVNSLRLGFVNLHVKDIRSIRTLGDLKQTLSQITLSKISKECLNVMDVASLVGAIILTGRVVSETAASVWSKCPKVSAGTWDILLKPVNGSITHSTNIYKLVRFILAARSTTRILRAESMASERFVQILELVMRTLEASKVVLDVCESVNIPAYQFLAQALSSNDIPLLATRLSTLLGFSCAFLALAVLATSVSLHHQFR